MTIDKTKDGSSLILKISGRLDTTTAPELEAEINASSMGITSLEFNFADLEYLSSAGLRVLLATQKLMNKQGKMVVKHVNSTIREVFDITGFADILTIED